MTTQAKNEQPAESSASASSGLVRMPTDIQAAANLLCKELPEGWAIKLCMENGAAWVELETPKCDTFNMDYDSDMSLADQMERSLKYAKEHVHDFAF